MKILLLDNYFYRKGGAESVYFNTGELLKRHGHEVIYFSQWWEENISNEDYFPKGISVSCKGIKEKLAGIKNYFYNVQAKKNLELIIQKEKPEIAHIHLFWGGLSSSVLSVLSKNNIPIVHTVHDYRMVCPAYAFKNSNGKVCEKCKQWNYYHCALHKCSKNSFALSILMTLEMYYRNIFFSPIKYIDGFIFVSNFCLDKHIEHLKSFSKTNNIVLYNYTTPLLERNLVDGGYYLYYGRLSFEKGIPTLLRVFAKHPELKIKVVGTGPLEKELKDKYQSDQASTETVSDAFANESIVDVKTYYENIEFLGYHSGEALAELVRNARYICVPSEWYENNPMTIVESYSYGKPVIGARIGGIPEIIDDGKTGFLFESGNEVDMEKAIMKADRVSEEEYSVLCNNAFSFYLSHFSSEHHYKVLLDFYRKTINLN